MIKSKWHPSRYNVDRKINYLVLMFSETLSFKFNLKVFPPFLYGQLDTNWPLFCWFRCEPIRQYWQNHPGRFGGGRFWPATNKLHFSILCNTETSLPGESERSSLKTKACKLTTTNNSHSLNILSKGSCPQNVQY